MSESTSVWCCFTTKLSKIQGTAAYEGLTMIVTSLIKLRVDKSTLGTIILMVCYKTQDKKQRRENDLEKKADETKILQTVIL